MFDEASGMSSQADFFDLRKECYKLVINNFEFSNYPNIAILAKEYGAHIRSME